MPLTAAQTRRLAEVRCEIDQIEHRLGTSHALGDSHTSQGISATFNDNQRWRNRLSVLRGLRDRLEAVENGEEIPPPPGMNLSYYRPDTGRFVT
jgi:hypothetical protein